MDKTLPIKGSWIFIPREVNTEIKVPALTLWYAMPHKIVPFGFYEQWGQYDPSVARMRSMGSKHLENLWRKRRKGDVEEFVWQETLTAFGTKVMDDYYGEYDSTWDWIEDNVSLEAQVKIITPEGSLLINPHEYNVIENIDPWMEMIDGEGMSLYEIGGVKATAKMADMMFYCQTRGLTKTQSYQIIAGDVTKSNVFYLQAHEAYAEYFGLVDTNKYTFEGEGPLRDATGAVLAEQERN